MDNRRSEFGILALITEVFPIVHEDWLDGALCSEVTSELFFPELGEAGFEAKRVCRLCTVSTHCLQWALDNHERGVWGATSDKDRQKIRRLSKSVTAA